MAEARASFWNLEHFNGEEASLRSLEQGYLELITAAGTVNVRSAAVGAYGAAVATIPNDAAGAEEAAGARQHVNDIEANDLFGALGYSTRVRVDNPPAAGQEFDIYAGILQPEAAQRVSSDGIFWFADEASANWILVQSRSGAQATANSGVAVAAGTFQTLEFRADITAGVILGFIDAVLVATVIPVNIQPAQRLTSMFALHSDALPTRALGVTLAVDWVGWGATF